MKIPYVNLASKYKYQKKKILSIVDQVFNTGNYVGGDNVKKFEKNICSYLNVKYCVALNSGTDALTLGLHALGIKKNDEVITTSNSFIASTSVIIHLGAVPIFVDVKSDQLINTDLIEKAITKKTKAIMVVHLTGRICEMNKIVLIAKKYKIPIIEDAAQAIGSRYNNLNVGTFGKVACFSAHPLKNLNAMGDSGYLVTNSKKIYEYVKNLSNHGIKDRNKVINFGYVSRMDNLQAAILNFRLKNLRNVIQKRRKNAKLYFNNLNKKYVFIPSEKKKEFNTYHTFVIQVPKRDELKKYLFLKGIQTSIHYPIPIHLQPAYKKLKLKTFNLVETEKQAKKILTLPINETLNDKEILYVCRRVNEFYEN